MLDSADAFDAALRAAWARAGGSSPHNFTDGPDLGGIIIDLEGGQYGVSRPVVLPKQGGGNVNIVDGSVRKAQPTGLAQNLDQLQASNRKLQSNYCANLRLLGRPCGFQVRALKAFGPLHNKDPQAFLFRFDGATGPGR